MLKQQRDALSLVHMPGIGYDEARKYGVKPNGRNLICRGGSFCVYGRLLGGKSVPFGLLTTRINL